MDKVDNVHDSECEAYDRTCGCASRQALKAENAALKAPMLSEDEWRSASFALGCLEARIDASGESHEMYDEAVEHSNTLRNLLERATR
jgi:hypothetical protein